MKSDSESSYYGRKIVRKEVFSDTDDTDDNDEDARLLRPSRPLSGASSMVAKFKRSSETLFDVRNLQNHFDEDAHLEEDTKFVVNAINESHESLSKLVSK